MDILDILSCICIDIERLWKPEVGILFILVHTMVSSDRYLVHASSSEVLQSNDRICPRLVSDWSWSYC